LRQEIYFSVHFFHLVGYMTECPNTQKNSWWRNWDPRYSFIKMAFIKEESEDMKIEEILIVKLEDPEEQTGWFHSQCWSHSF